MNSSPPTCPTVSAWRTLAASRPATSTRARSPSRCPGVVDLLEPVEADGQHGEGGGPRSARRAPPGAGRTACGWPRRSAGRRARWVSSNRGSCGRDVAS
jgi:hypothetical protein